MIHGPTVIVILWEWYLLVGAVFAVLGMLIVVIIRQWRREAAGQLPPIGDRQQSGTLIAGVILSAIFFVIVFVFVSAFARFAV
jgi:hypothetical protein